MKKTKTTTIATVEDPVKTPLNNYMSHDVVADFSAIPREAKLSILQRTPAMFIKERKVGNTMVKYVEHTFARKALNYVFNFNYSVEIKNKEYVECEESSPKGKRKVIEAECEVVFTFHELNLTRTVISSHKGYPNPATTRGDIMKSALSKAYTKVAQTFGMATEEEYIPAAKEDYIEEQDTDPDYPLDEKPAKPTKSFELNY